MTLRRHPGGGLSSVTDTYCHLVISACFLLDQSPHLSLGLLKIVPVRAMGGRRNTDAWIVNLGARLLGGGAALPC